MFDDDLPQKNKVKDFPRNLEFLSVADLKDYISDLESEIERAQGDVDKKKASQDVAATFFK